MGPRQRLQLVDPGADQIIALLEVYAASAAAYGHVAVEFALRGEDGANRAATRARVQVTSKSGSQKGIAEGALQLANAAPGRYAVTATLLVNGKPAGFTRRDLVIGPGH